MSAPDAGVLRAALERGGRADVDVHTFASLGSTNAWLTHGDGAALPDCALCMTDHQPAGAGRRGRVWEALPGNLTFSLLRSLALPAEGPGPLALVTGIGVADALGAATAIPVRLKWPNDLLIGDSKVGGLLIEARHEGGGMAARNETGRLRVVGGIGINLVEDERLAAIGATSLSAHGVAIEDRDALLVTVALSVFEAWDRYAASGWAGFAEHWDALDALRDRRVDVHEGPIDAATVFQGVARGVDADGALRVDTEQGQRRVHAADVSIRPVRRGANR